MAGNGCQTHAGILKPNDGTLTEIAKKKFIKEVKEEMIYGSDNLPEAPLFPCGESIPPIEYAHLLNIEDEKKFPEFHKNALGAYQNIAQKLDLASDYKFLPVCCPVSLGLKLGVRFRLKFIKGFLPYMGPALPLLALKMKVLPPVKLAAQFPTIPSVEPPFPKFDIPPNIKVPDYFTFADYTMSYSLGIPKLLATLAAKTPELALKLVNPPELFKGICQTAFDSRLFGDIEPKSTTQLATTKVLTRKVVEMTFIAAVGTTLGSSPGGLTGGIGTYLGYVPPDPEDEDPADDPRMLIVQFANSMAGVSYSSDKDTYASNLFYKEYDVGDPASKQRTYGFAKFASSCGLFARACYYRAGAQEPFFTEEYQVGTAISGLISLAQAKGALIPFSKDNFPRLRAGDSIIVSESPDTSDAHVMVVTSDYGGGLGGPIYGVEGGIPDYGNNNASTSIAVGNYDILGIIDGKLKTGKSQGLVSPAKSILAIIEGEKIVRPLL